MNQSTLIISEAHKADVTVRLVSFQSYHRLRLTGTYEAVRTMISLARSSTISSGSKKMVAPSFLAMEMASLAEKSDFQLRVAFSLNYELRPPLSLHSSSSLPLYTRL